MDEVALIGKEITGQNGTYLIERHLARGTRSNIYQVVSTDLQQYACAKILSFQTTNDDLKMLQREEMFLSQLDHPNIVKLYDTAVIGGFHCTIMEYFPDGSLADRLRAGPLNHDILIHILEQVAAAIDYAHDHSVVHQDIKPANILLNKNRAALSDFGVARIFGEQLQTKSGAFQGTPAYMSPEQTYGDRPQKESDVYALAVVTFQALTGQIPYKGNSSMSTLMAILNEPVPDLRDLNPEISGAVNDVVQAALAKKPAHRYASAMAFVQSLKRAIRNPESDPILPEVKEPPVQPAGPQDTPQDLWGDKDNGTQSFEPVPPPPPIYDTVTESLYSVSRPASPDAFAFQQKLLLQEVKTVQASIAKASRLSLAIKALALVIWWVSLLVGLTVLGLRPYLLGTALLPLLFWLTEFFWQWHGYDYHDRLKVLASFLNDEDVLASFLNDVSFEQSYKRTSLSSFPVIDPLGNLHNTSRFVGTLFSLRLFPIYLLQIVVSVVVGLWLS